MHDQCMIYRPESRQGQVALSHLGTPRPHPSSTPQDPAHPADMHSPQAASSSSMSTSMMQLADIQPAAIQSANAADDASASMTPVEAAALGASSPGAVVRMPTSTALSQADQIALRYHHQVILLPRKHAGCICTTALLTCNAACFLHVTMLCSLHHVCTENACR